MTKPSFAGRTLVAGVRPPEQPPAVAPAAVTRGAAEHRSGCASSCASTNLTDTRTPDPSLRRAGVTPAQCPVGAARFRTPDGSYNALDDPDMGMAGTRFGRNVSLDKAFPEAMPGLMTPNPHTISRTLMRRKEFTPATTLNLLAASWIQFQTHDWFAHARDNDVPVEVDLPDGHAWHENPMRVPADAGPTTPGREKDAHLPPTYINRLTHWWDSSSIYGSSEEERARVRTFTDGKLAVKDGRLPLDAKTGTAITGFSENWWIGLGMLHTLFALEHNAICDALKKKHPEMSDEELFGTAQLVERRADRQDPHRRVDAGDHRPPGAEDRHARQLVGPARRAAAPDWSAGSARTRSSAASRARPPTSTGRRTS